MYQGSKGRMASSLAPSSQLTSAHPFFSADVLKKCALIALHLIAEEGKGSEGGHTALDMLCPGNAWRIVV